MKKLLQRIQYFLQQLNRNWNPRYLRCQNLALQRYIDKLNSKLAGMRGEPNEATARAMLMQLRVHGESVRRRTGYMVSAFVAQSVIERLLKLDDDSRKKFTATVAEVLVENALTGLYKRSSATNKLTALIFEPITARGQNVQLVGGIFETDQKPEFVPMVDKATLAAKLNVPAFEQLTYSK